MKSANHSRNKYRLEIQGNLENNYGYFYIMASFHSLNDDTVTFKLGTSKELGLSSMQHISQHIISRKDSSYKHGSKIFLLSFSITCWKMV